VGKLLAHEINLPPQILRKAYETFIPAEKRNNTMQLPRKRYILSWGNIGEVECGVGLRRWMVNTLGYLLRKLTLQTKIRRDLKLT